MQELHSSFMQKAIQLSRKSIQNGGGPFAAVIVKNGEIIASSSNSVTKDNDPTAHAEVNAIRKASKILNNFDLSECVIYTSCEPCPMCLGAIYWSRIKRVYYANTKSDAKKSGFDDSFIYNEIDLPLAKRKVVFEQLMHAEAMEVFEEWGNMDNKIEY